MCIRDRRLTTSLKILEDISKNKPPKFYKVFLGCSVWGYKQFNNEMLENSWHLMDTSNEIIFQNDDINQIWEICVEKSGIIMIIPDFSTQISHIWLISSF